LIFTRSDHVEKVFPTIRRHRLAVANYMRGVGSDAIIIIFIHQNTWYNKTISNSDEYSYERGLTTCLISAL